jgi:hypothetical protein
MEDPSKMVGTIYDYELAKKVSYMRKNFKGGRALFTQPPAPLKCGGAPQKIVYLCEDYWKKHGIKADIHFYTPLSQIFGVTYYSEALTEIALKKGVTLHYTTELIKVVDGVATFKNNSNGTIFEEKFDFLHAIPHLGAPQYLIGSSVSNPAGFVEVDRTMRHKKYHNVWALGDCVALPNAKTAAAAYSEAPILVHNLKNQLEKTSKPFALYDGYSACPLYITKGTLLLAEFAEYNDENGKLVKGIDESFHPGKQNKPTRFYYWMTYACTYLYRLGITGHWYGKKSIFRPTFKPDEVDIRKFYKYLIYLGYVPVMALVYLILSLAVF